jgi:hypothetical protein
MAASEEHLQQLKTLEGKRFTTFELIHAGEGVDVIKFNGLVLPAGWSTPTTNVYFVVPSGYPIAKPDGFWTDPSLRLASGAPPTNIGKNQHPGVPEGLHWFSWHANSWNPNRDNLVTYLGVIRKRFEQTR